MKTAVQSGLLLGVCLTKFQLFSTIFLCFPPFCISATICNLKKTQFLPQAGYFFTLSRLVISLAIFTGGWQRQGLKKSVNFVREFLSYQQGFASQLTSLTIPAVNIFIKYILGMTIHTRGMSHILAHKIEPVFNDKQFQPHYLTSLILHTNSQALGAVMQYPFILRNQKFEV